MGLTRSQKLRIFLLALTFGGVLWVLLRALLGTNSETQPQTSSFIFPAKVPLQEWQLIKATPIKEEARPTNPGQHYEYRQGNEPERVPVRGAYLRQHKPLTVGQNNHRLNIQARYEMYTDGNVSRLLAVYTPIKPATVNLELKHRQGIGFYGVFSDQEKVYLSACINPQGESTLTEQQFVHNKYTYNWSIKRTLLWIVGQNDLFDGRCLWTLMSLPITLDLNVTQPEQAYHQLETAWFNWYRWWQSKLGALRLGIIRR